MMLRGGGVRQRTRHSLALHPQRCIPYFFLSEFGSLQQTLSNEKRRARLLLTKR